MIWLRKTALVLHLLRGLVTCAVVFPWLGGESRRRHIRAWSRKLLRICGVEVEIPSGFEPSRGALVVANHISWLDIFVLNAWRPFRFVAKSEIRSWPLIGWLCVQTGTLFIERGKKRDTHRALHHIADCLLQGNIVCVFPEGTTSDGSSVLPFHANLLQAAISARKPVQPVALRYLDKSSGRLTKSTAYIDDLSLIESLEMILRSPPIAARVLAGPEVHHRDGDRRGLGIDCRRVIETLLEQGSNAHASEQSNVSGGFPLDLPGVSYGADREALK
ncbi:lysophospholipid acyltransferase family protein [Cupriavidus oxalaticus]|uniref:lysophospholipid acyltransferase family protein n=1 Tax=Cupriavidus oxalaticus TaxID=96344 RepID=UPI0040339386